MKLISFLFFFLFSSSYDCSIIESIKVENQLHSNTDYPTNNRKLYDFSSANIEYIEPSEGIPHHWFGSSVYISEGVAIIGASGDGDYTKYGNAYIYKEKDNKWIEIAKLTSNNPQLDDGFGTAVSIYLGFAFVGAYRLSETLIDSLTN